MADQWFFARGQQQVGPMTLAELVRQLPAAGGPNTMVFGPGMQGWERAADVPQVARAMDSAGATPPPPNTSGGTPARSSKAAWSSTAPGTSSSP